jgi:hypothetical protein
MKFLLPLALSCCLYLPSNAQNDSLCQAFIKKYCGQSHVSLSPKWVTSDEKLPPSFSQFEVVDFRPDTSRLGFWGIDKQRREFVFHEPVPQTISSFLNHYTHPAGTKSFLIIIKKLWLHDNAIPVKLPRQPLERGKIEFRGEAFLKTPHGYLPYTYLDTVVTSAYSVKDMVIFRLPNVFYDLLRKIAAANEENLTKRNVVYSLGQLDSLNKKQFDFRMDTATVLKPGVYASVEEFRNNQPSILNYDIRPDENGLTQLYLKDETGNSYFSRKMWGYCDGYQCYAMMDGNLFPILSVHHSFYVFGSKQYDRKSNIVPILIFIPGLGILGAMPISETAIRRLNFFSIDPYTGKIN